MSYPYLEVSLDQSRVEQASELLLELGATGLEERDQGTMIAAPAGQAVVVAWFAARSEADAAARQLPELLGDIDGAPPIEVGEVEDPGWREAWRDYFRPMRFGRRLWVAPPDEDPPAGQLGDDEPVVIRLIPSGAFGTGTHESTALMLELVDEVARPGMSVLDVGCGSAILAMAALGLGASRAWGIDIDAEALGYAEENAENNKLLDRCRLDGTPLGDVDGRYDLVLANLTAPDLAREKHALVARVAPGGLLAWSGILIDDLPELGSPPAMELVRDLRRNEWAAQLWRLVDAP